MQPQNQCPPVIFDFAESYRFDFVIIIFIYLI